MSRSVVVIDPERSLPSSFFSDAASRGVDARLEHEPHALASACDAHVVVVVARRSSAHEQARDCGMLAAIDRRRDQRLVLVVSDVHRQRRIVIQAARHGATVLIDEPTSVLAACLRDLLLPLRLPPAARKAFGAAMSALCVEARSLLLLAADRAHPTFRSAQLAKALDLSRRTLTRRVRSAGLPSVRELIEWGRLVRVAALTAASDPLAVRARAGGFPSARGLARMSRRLLGHSHDALGGVTLDVIAGVLTMSGYAVVHSPDRAHADRRDERSVRRRGTGRRNLSLVPDRKRPFSRTPNCP